MTAVGVFLFVSCLQGAVQIPGLFYLHGAVLSVARPRMERR